MENPFVEKPKLSPNWSVFMMNGHVYLMNGPIIICKLK